jgi:hypothetical protein
MQEAQQSLMPPQTPPAPTCYKPVLDTLAEVLQEEGTQQFQHQFFEQVNEHTGR